MFAKNSGASIDNPQCFYIDEHNSHWDANAHDCFAQHNVYISFLKSNDSALDQPNDLGPNSSFKSYLIQWLDRKASNCAFISRLLMTYYQRLGMILVNQQN
jgi:hypothetical protein